VPAAFTFARASGSTQFDPSLQLSYLGNEVPDIEYEPATLQPLGLALFGQQRNDSPNNIAAGIANGGVHSYAVSTDIAPPYPGATVWKLTKGANPDSNFCNANQITCPVSSAIFGSVWMYIPPSSTATLARISCDAASANIAWKPYDLANKGRWQRPWRLYTSSSSAANTGCQIRIDGMTSGHSLYVCLLHMAISTAYCPTIVTSGSALTRALETLRLSDVAFAPMLNAPWKTAIVEVTIPQLPAAGSANLLQLDDDTDNNRVLLRYDATGAAINGYRVVGGVGSAAAPVGTTTSGAVIRVGITMNATDAKFVGPTGTIASLTGGALAPTKMRIGNRAVAGSNILNGYARLAATYPYTVSDARLQAMIVLGAPL
jgi:hypothetical protein